MSIHARYIGSRRDRHGCAQVARKAASLSSVLITEPSPVTPNVPPHFLVGKASVQRVGHWGSTKYALIQNGDVLAHIGRSGWLRIYMGRGQWISLADGDEWRARSVGAHGSITPVILDSNRRTVAIAGSNHGAYGTTGKDFACSLHPAEVLRFGRANDWTLRDLEDDIATITRYPLSVDAHQPVHLGAVFLSFILVRHGLPDDSIPRVPAFRWG